MGYRQEIHLREVWWLIRLPRLVASNLQQDLAVGYTERRQPVPQVGGTLARQCFADAGGGRGVQDDEEHFVVLVFSRRVDQPLCKPAHFRCRQAVRAGFELRLECDAEAASQRRLHEARPRYRPQGEVWRVT